MLRVPFETMIVLYLLGALGTVGVSWGWHEWRARRRAVRARRFRLRCARCALEWEDPTAGPLPTCPRCGSVNERTLPPEL